MKNVINYYYNLYPESIFQNKDGYYFFIGNVRYYLFKYIGNITDADSIYGMHLDILRRGLYVHLIVLNRDGSSITRVNSSLYVLLKVTNYDGDIDLNNLLLFSDIVVSNGKCDWARLWSEKNDYLEYQINMLGHKYPLIRDSFSYYLGLGETAIAIVNNLEGNSSSLVYCHRKISKKNNSFFLYNPFNIIVDLKVRDVAEYFKRSFFDGYDINDELNEYFVNSKLSAYEYMMFFARMIYPTYYFDIYEEVITGRVCEKILLPIINKTFEYEKVLKKIYRYYKGFLDVFPIEWLE